MTPTVQRGRRLFEACRSELLREAGGSVHHQERVAGHLTFVTGQEQEAGGRHCRTQHLGGDGLAAGSQGFVHRQCSSHVTAWRVDLDVDDS